MKLDVTKAFDRMDWSFLLAALDKMGLGGLLTQFLKSSFATASSSVLLNGIPSRKITLSRSVRQGCPCHPSCSSLLLTYWAPCCRRRRTKARSREFLSQESIRGPYITSLLDDVYMVIRAVLLCITAVQLLLDTFGRASGLVVCVWAKTLAAIIPAGPIPPALALLPWTWENDATATPLLGIPVAQTLSSEKMESMVTTKLDGKLAKMKLRHLNLAARITVANSILVYDCGVVGQA